MKAVGWVGMTLKNGRLGASLFVAGKLQIRLRLYRIGAEYSILLRPCFVSASAPTVHPTRLERVTYSSVDCRISVPLSLLVFSLVPSNSASILTLAAFGENRRVHCGSRRNRKSGKGYAKTDVRFWKDVLFKPKYTEAGRRIESREIRLPFRRPSAMAGRSSQNSLSCNHSD